MFLIVEFNLCAHFTSSSAHGVDYINCCNLVQHLHFCTSSLFTGTQHWHEVRILPLSDTSRILSQSSSTTQNVKLDIDSQGLTFVLWIQLFSLKNKLTHYSQNTNVSLVTQNYMSELTQELQSQIACQEHAAHTHTHAHCLGLCHFYWLCTICKRLRLC